MFVAGPQRVPTRQEGSDAGLQRYFDTLVAFEDGNDRLELEGSIPFASLTDFPRIIRREQYNTLIAILREAWSGQDRVINLASVIVSATLYVHTRLETLTFFSNEQTHKPAEGIPWQIASHDLQPC